MLLFFESPGFTSPHPTAITTTSDSSSRQPRLDLPTLQKALQSYYHQGLAASTQKTYAAGVQHYFSFCEHIHNSPLPTSEQTLLLFVTYLGQLELTHKTIKVYLSAVRNLHITTGHFTIFETQLSPRVERVLKGIKLTQAKSKPPRSRLPITSSIMRKIRAVLAKSPHDYNNIMLWAACCLAFFGFLRCSEFTIPSQDTFDDAVHLSFKDISVDDWENPKVIAIRIKQSKTDPFRKGVTLMLGKTDDMVCPVSGLLPYLAIRGSKHGPLFIMANKHYLTPPLFRTSLHQILKSSGLSTQEYNTHSFRIGSATSAKAAGISDLHIKMLGRWQSDAYQSYIKTSPEDLAKYSKLLVISK